MICHECGVTMRKRDAWGCSRCGGVFCPKHIYQYVDGNNEAITRNSPRVCGRCYRVMYGPSVRVLHRGATAE